MVVINIDTLKSMSLYEEIDISSTDKKNYGFVMSQ